MDRVVVVVTTWPSRSRPSCNGETHIREWATVRQAEPRGTGDALRGAATQLRSERFLVINGDDLYGAADLAALAAFPAGRAGLPVDGRAHWGVAFLRPDGTLESWSRSRRSKGGTRQHGRLPLPTRGLRHPPGPVRPREYEITDYVTKLAERQPVSVVAARFWLPIGHVEAWQQAQQVDLAAVMAGR